MKREPTEMELRVAAALRKVNGEPPFEARTFLGAVVTDPYLNDARAAIRAMREPTDEMASIIDNDNMGEKSDLFVSIYETWANAIDAASPPDAESP